MKSMRAQYMAKLGAICYLLRGGVRGCLRRFCNLLYRIIVRRTVRTACHAQGHAEIASKTSEESRLTGLCVALTRDRRIPGSIRQVRCPIVITDPCTSRTGRAFLRQLEDAQALMLRRLVLRATNAQAGFEMNIICQDIITFRGCCELPTQGKYRGAVQREQRRNFPSPQTQGSTQPTARRSGLPIFLSATVRLAACAARERSCRTRTTVNVSILALGLCENCDSCMKHISREIACPAGPRTNILIAASWSCTGASVRRGIVFERECCEESVTEGDEPGKANWGPHWSEMAKPVVHRFWLISYGSGNEAHDSLV
jgi:hypothetical protein